MAEPKPARIQTLTGAIPWILYFALPYAGRPVTAVVAGFVAASCATAYARARGANVKLVDWTTLAFFALGTIASVARGSTAAMFSHYNFVLLWILFAAMAWISILAGKPFTLQFARESTPREFWSTALFHHANVLITLAWAAAFSLNLLVALVALELGGAEAIVARFFPFAAMAGAIVFMNRYRASIQRLMPAQAPTV